jgi:hypothetical protein
MPSSVIIGTGAYGVAKISDDVLLELKNRRIKAIVAKTKEAVKRFNLYVPEDSSSAIGRAKVIGLFHLTC